MVFNSFEFLWFFALVMFLYWVPLRRWVWGQNCLLLAVSYVFYGWWDWRFLGLLLLNSMIDFFTALALDATESPRWRKGIIIISLISNLGMLGFFKYYNFFADSLVRLSTLR